MLPGVRHDLPRPGEDSEGILGDFGFTTAEIAALVESSAVTTAPALAH